MRIVEPVPCLECGRNLKSRKSRDMQRGPACQKKYEKRTKEKQQQFNLNVMKRAAEPTVVPLERYIVSDEGVYLTVTRDAYAGYRAAWPDSKLEVLVYADHILYQAERDEQYHDSADRTENPQWFKQVLDLLRSGIEGVVRMKQAELELAV